MTFYRKTPPISSPRPRTLLTSIHATRRIKSSAPIGEIYSLTTPLKRALNKDGAMQEHRLHPNSTREKSGDIQSIGFCANCKSALYRFATPSLSCRHNNVGTHHLVILVLEHVTMPDVPARVSFELHNDAGHGHRIHADCILPSQFIRR